MIEPTLKSIGKAVWYKPHPGTAEKGTITSFNEQYVFVRYGWGSSTSKATTREDLVWA